MIALKRQQEISKTNGHYMRSNINDKLITALLSVATAGVISCIGFLWNLNGTIAHLQENSLENLKSREEWSIRTNNMQLDIRDIRERLIRIETKTQKQ